jgi:exopolysaccharide production protein ExoZ
LLALGAFFSLGLLGNDDNRALMWGAPLALLVAGALELPALAGGRVRDFSKLLGDASYSLYLVQFVVLPPSSALLGRMVRSLPLPLAAMALVVGLIAVATVAGVVTYYVAERPMTQLARRWIKRD